jgi:multisubunit Na+/H+ antiporter MnhC subunit
MRRVGQYLLIAVCLATLIIGLSILGAAIAYQIVDYRDGQSKHKLTEIENKLKEK